MPNQPPAVGQEFQLADHRVQVELPRAPQLSELFFNQFDSKLNWITATCSLVTVFYWWTSEQTTWYARLSLSFVSNLLLHLTISGVYALCFAARQPPSESKNDLQTSNLKTNEEQTNEAAHRASSHSPDDKSDKKQGDQSKRTKRRDWLNHILAEIWPRICSNYKWDNLESDQSLGRFICLNKLNLTKTRAPTVEQVNLVNRLDTPNGQMIVLDLAVQIDWQTSDNENLLSLSISDLQFTISNLHSIAGRLRLRLCLHYVGRRSKGKLYKLNVSLLERPEIRQYETSGAAYLLQVFNLHLAFIDWLVANFLLFPRSLLFLLDKHFFELDTLTERLRNESFLDLDLDDLSSLALQHKSIGFFEQLAGENVGQIEEPDLNRPSRANKEKMRPKNETKTVEREQHQKFSNLSADKKMAKEVVQVKENKTKEQFGEKVKAKEPLEGTKAKETLEKKKSKETGRSEQRRSDQVKGSEKVRGSEQVKASEQRRGSQQRRRSEPLRSTRSVRRTPDQQMGDEHSNRLKLFQKALNRSLKSRIARYVLHTSVMYSLNVPKAFGPVLANSSYFVRIRIGDLQLTTNSHLTKEPVPVLVLYWMQSFMVAASRLNWPVYLAVLVGQRSQQANGQSNKQEADKMTADQTIPDSYLYWQTEHFTGKRQFAGPVERGAVQKRSLPKLKECFEIKLTDNLEQFLTTHNLNGRLYTVEDEISKCRVTVRFSVFNLRIYRTSSANKPVNKLPAYKLPIYKSPVYKPPDLKIQEHPNKLADTVIGLPVGVLSLFISHLTNVQFISDRSKEMVEPFCWLSVRSSAQEHLFRSQVVGNQPYSFRQGAFLLVFRPAIERLQFKVYFAKGKRSKARSSTKETGQAAEPVNLVNASSPLLATAMAAFHQPISVKAEQQPGEPTAEEPPPFDRIKSDFQSLAWCSLTLGSPAEPRYEKLKLNGALKDAHLHVYHCYSKTVNAKRLAPIMIDSEQTCLNYIEDAAQ